MHQTGHKVQRNLDQHNETVHSTEMDRLHAQVSNNEHILAHFLMMLGGRRINARQIRLPGKLVDFALSRRPLWWRVRRAVKEVFSNER